MPGDVLAFSHTRSVPGPDCGGARAGRRYAAAHRWEFLQRYLDDAGGGSSRTAARERGLRLRKIAATLASRLSPHWREHADDVVRLVERYAGIHSVISPGDAHSPLAYLARMLDRALNNPHAVVPWPSPVRDAAERAAQAVHYAVAAARAAALAADFADRSAAADAERAGDRTARAAAAGAGRTLPRPSRPGDPDDAARMAAARAEIAQLATIRPAAAEVGGWPVEAQPGAGLPDGWRPGDGH